MRKAEKKTDWIYVLCIGFLIMLVGFEIHLSDYEDVVLYTDVKSDTNGSIELPINETTEIFNGTIDKDVSGADIYISAINMPEGSYLEYIIDNENGEVQNYEIDLSDYSVGGRIRLFFPNSIGGGTRVSVIPKLPEDVSTDGSIISVMTRDEAIFLNFFDGYISSVTIKIIVLIGCLFLFLVSTLIGLASLNLNVKYFVFGGLVGIIYLIVVPSLSVPDAYTHYLRAYEISCGYIKSETNDVGDVGRELPDMNYLTNVTYTSNYSDIVSNINDLEDSENYHWYSFTNQAMYSPLAYLSQVPGIIIGRLFSDKTFFIMMFGKLSAFILGLLLIMESIRIVDTGRKYIILFMSLMPMFIHQMASLSADSITNVACIYIVAHAIYLYKKDRIGKADYAIMFIIMMVVAMTKIVYFPLCLIYFIVPRHKFGSKKKYMYVVISFFATIMINVLWFKISFSYLDNDFALSRGINSGEQVKYILSNPIRFLEIIYSTIEKYAGGWLWGIFGQSLVMSKANMSSVVLIVCFSILFLLFVNRDEGEEFLISETKNRVLIGIIILLILGLTFSSLYVQWTKYANDIIEGIQGRYFIPLILPLSYLVRISTKKQYDKYLFPFLGYLHVYTIILMIEGLTK